MFDEKVNQLVKILEKQELENSIQDPKIYCELFSCYLYLEDLVNARFLWKRIPNAMKVGNNELQQMHKIFQALWKNDMSEFYKLIDFKWSSSTSEVMFELKEKVQASNIQLIGKSYTSIFENVFAEMTNNHTPEMVNEECKRLNWEIEEGPHPRLIIPKKQSVHESSALDSEDQLKKLTYFVSFLEN